MQGQEQGQEAPPSRGEVLKRKLSRAPSNAWVYFTRKMIGLLVTIVNSHMLQIVLAMEPLTC